MDEDNNEDNKTATKPFIPPAYDPNYRHPWLDHYRKEAVRQAPEEEEARLLLARLDEERRLREVEQARLRACEIEARIQERVMVERRAALLEEVRVIMEEWAAVRGRTNFITYWTALHFHDHAVYPSDSDELGDYEEV
jgi:hypothetical protein